METLSSRDNPIIKNCRSLAADAHQRREQGLCMLEGVRLCCDAAASGVEVTQLLVTADALERWEPQLGELISKAKRCHLITDSVSGTISQTKNSQGVYCICAMPQAEPELVFPGRFVLLDRIQDPGNLGTIIRCAEAFGVTQLLLSQGCADIWSPKVLRSTMGSVFRQPVAVAASLAGTVAALCDNGVQVYAAALDTTAVTPEKMTQGSGGIAVVVGNEGSGVSQQVLEQCSGRVYIPMTPAIESLNAAAAATVLMWELARCDK